MGAVAKICGMAFNGICASSKSCHGPGHSCFGASKTPPARPQLGQNKTSGVIPARSSTTHPCPQKNTWRQSLLSTSGAQHARGCYAAVRGGVAGDVCSCSRGPPARSGGGSSPAFPTGTEGSGVASRSRPFTASSRPGVNGESVNGTYCPSSAAWLLGVLPPAPISNPTASHDEPSQPGPSQLEPSQPDPSQPGSSQRVPELMSSSQRSHPQPASPPPPCGPENAPPPAHQSPPTGLPSRSARRASPTSLGRPPSPRRQNGCGSDGGRRGSSGEPGGGALQLGPAVPLLLRCCARACLPAAAASRPGSLRTGAGRIRPATGSPAAPPRRLFPDPCDPLSRDESPPTIPLPECACPIACSRPASSWGVVPPSLGGVPPILGGRGLPFKSGPFLLRAESPRRVEFSFGGSASAPCPELSSGGAARSFGSVAFSFDNAEVSSPGVKSSSGGAPCSARGMTCAFDGARGFSESVENPSDGVVCSFGGRAGAYFRRAVGEPVGEAGDRALNRCVPMDSSREMRE
eukprot:scaffold13569_cov87-Isochrysis_galbana.AAC.3